MMQNTFDIVKHTQIDPTITFKCITLLIYAYIYNIYIYYIYNIDYQNVGVNCFRFFKYVLYYQKSTNTTKLTGSIELITHHIHEYDWI